LGSKKTLPLINTIPQVPISDTILHPRFNVLTRQFEFPQETSLFDCFYFSPFEPQDQLSRKTIPIRQLGNNDSLTIEKDDPFANKIELSRRENLEKGLGSSDWMLGIILFSLFLFGWLRFGYGKFVNIAIQASFNYFAARRINDEANILRNRVFGFMNFLFFINLSLFIDQWICYNQFSIPIQKGLLLFFAILAAVLTIYFFKGMILWLLDFLFLAKGVFNYYNNTVFIYNRMVGLFLLPLVSILPFINRNTMPGFFLLGFIVIFLFYSLRIFRGLQIGFKNRLSIFYLILYLCALEFLPIMVVYKLLVT
jgi:hypothetical protein